MFTPELGQQRLMVHDRSIHREDFRAVVLLPEIGFPRRRVGNHDDPIALLESFAAGRFDAQGGDDAHQHHVRDLSLTKDFPQARVGKRIQPPFARHFQDAATVGLDGSDGLAARGIGAKGLRVLDDFGSM